MHPSVLFILSPPPLSPPFPTTTQVPATPTLTTSVAKNAIRDKRHPRHKSTNDKNHPATNLPANARIATKNATPARQTLSNAPPDFCRQKRDPRQNAPRQHPIAQDAKSAKGRVAILNHQGAKTPRRAPSRGTEGKFRNRRLLLLHQRFLGASFVPWSLGG